jgi:hypothetical protein
MSANGLWAVIALAEGIDGQWRSAAEVLAFVAPEDSDQASADSAQAVKSWASPKSVAKWARLSECLASVHRIRIMAKLFEGPATYQSLCKASKLQSGPLYHHIGLLRSAGMVGPKERDLYALTRTGRSLLIGTMLLTRLVSGRG